MSRRIHIERLELDLRGIDPKTAEAATRRLGPSLEKALAQRRGRFDSAPRIDAGSIAPASESHDVASGLAHQIAQRVRRS
jgi:hypothetical protein